jgi:hypothetical protein
MPIKLGHALLLCWALGACHRPTEVRGIYVSQDRAGTLFPCDDPKSAVIVSDTALAARYQRALSTPNEGLYVRLRGINARSGSIYSGRRYFVVQQILEVRARARSECPQVAHPLSSVLPS